jgi:hypothetical protein
MPRIRFRWLLPLGHAAVDLVLLAAWISYGASLIRQEKLRSSATIRLISFQDDSSVGWEPRPPPPPPPKFALLITGTLPAGVVSMSLRPEAWYITRHKLWDPVWLLIHEAVAIPFWFLMGLWIDTGRSRLRKVMLYYLIGRAGLGLLVLGPWTAPNFGILLQGLFWLGLGVYGFGCGVQSIVRGVDAVCKKAKA